jgi:hypothetical protein
MASIADQVYEYLINKGMSPESARAQADRVERTQERQAATTPAILGSAASFAGAVPKALQLARDMYSGYRGLSGAERLTNTEQRALPAPGRSGLPAEISPSGAPATGSNPMPVSASAARNELMGEPRLVGSQAAGESPAYGASFHPNLTNPPRTNGTSVLPMAMSVLGMPGEEAKPEPRVISPEDLFDMRRESVTPADLFDMRANIPAPANVPLPPPRPSGLDRPAPVRPAPERAAQIQEAAAKPENMTIRQLWEAANASGEARDFARADQAMQAAIKKSEDVGFYGQPEGKKAGGSVGGKPDAVHKALEIIHHLISNR